MGNSASVHHPVQYVTEPQRAPLLFLAYAVVSQTVGGDLKQLLARALGPSRSDLVWYGAFAAVILLGLALWYREEQARRIANRANEEQRREIERLRSIRPDIGAVVPSMPRRGLIVPISPGVPDEIPAHCAIRHHFVGIANDPAQPKLERLWLLHTPEPPAEPAKPSQSSYKNAMDLREQYTALGCAVELVCLDNFLDPREVFYKVDEVYSRSVNLYGMAPTDVVADITGGTKLMSIGIALAGAHQGRDLQLTESGRKDNRGRGLPDPTCTQSNFLLVDVRSARAAGGQTPFIAGELARS